MMQESKKIISGKLYKDLIRKVEEEVFSLQKRKVKKPPLFFLFIVIRSTLFRWIVSLIIPIIVFVILYVLASTPLERLGAVVVFFLLLFILYKLLFRSFSIYPKSVVEANLTPSVNYNLLLFLLKELLKIKKFRGSNVEICIYTDYKEKRVIKEFLEKLKMLNLLGIKLILFPFNKKTVAELKINKWEVYIVDNDIRIKLHHKVRLVSEKAKTRSGKIKELAKTTNDIRIDIDKSGNQKSYSDTRVIKKEDTLIPVYSLEEPTYNYVLGDLSYYLE